MGLAQAEGLWRPDLAKLALEAPSVEPLRLPGWECRPYEVQTRGITWLYATPRSLLGDVTGTGKTIHGIGLSKLLEAQGELAEGRRAIFSLLATSVGQWMEEFERFAPGMEVVTNAGLDRAKRRALYRRRDWKILVTSHDLMWRDKELLTEPWQLVWFDESSAFRTRETMTAAGARTISSNAARIHCTDATPIQNKLEDGFSQLEVMGLAGYSGSVFGNEWEFDNRYIVRAPETVRIKGGKLKTRMVVTGYRNLEEFRTKLAPFYLRRTEGSADMPDVAPPEDVWLEMGTEQRRLYDGVMAGSIKTNNWLMAAQQILAGTGTWTGDDGGESVKLDWLMHALQTRFVDPVEGPEKVVVFSRFKPTGRELARRLDRAGIGYAFFDGDHRKERDANRHRFWDDPACRVAIGTTAMERSLNLQVARYVVTIDLMFNPGRIEQLLGRVKRAESKHQTVFLVRLMCLRSLESGVMKILRAKQNLADAVNGEVTDLFNALTPDEQALVAHG